MVPVELVEGDITAQHVDAIVTAANSALRGGGGVDGAIHRAAGPELLRACRALGGCDTGDAVWTPAFALESNGVRCVVHAVGPVWHGGKQNEDALLARAYTRAVEVADAQGCKSIAFPSISSGVYGFPIERAAPLAVEALRKAVKRAKNVRKCVLVAFDRATHAAFSEALRG
jgi:O-acetyl-ADP-ribose deacetylase